MYMTFLESTNGRSASGWVKCSSTSVSETFLVAPRSNTPKFEPLSYCTSAAVAQLYRTSSAVNSLPLWKVMPDLSLSCQTSPAALGSSDSARCGIGLRLSSRSKSFS